MHGNSGWTHGWFSSVGRPGVCEGPPHPSGYEDTHQQQHDDAQQPREFNSGKYSLSERCDPLSGGDGYYMSTLSPHPPAKCCHMRDLPAVSRRYASFKRHTHEELPPSEPLYVKGSKRYSDRSVHPDFSSGQQIDDFRDFRDDSTSHSYLKKSFSAVEFLREVSKKLDHTTDETSQLLDGVETEDNNADSPGLFGTGNIRHCPSSSSSAWQSFVNNLETGEKRQGMMPVLFDDPEGGIKRSSNPFNRGSSDTHHDCPTTTSTARLNFPENTNTLHQHNTMNGSDEQVYNKQDYCSGENTRPVSPDLFASQDPYHTTTPPSFNLQNGNSSTPQRVYNSQHDPHESRAQGSGEQIHESIRHSLGREDCDTARESHIRFSPKISLTRTEDTYRRGLSGGMVRVSTVEGEMILNPRHWRLARTFTGLLGHKKIQFVEFTSEFGEETFRVHREICPWLSDFDK
ncbi:hypothetical protein Hamer_G004482 [Homarus americanus]|uniref:Uncharacterized protein n=1 Tax=Homarus americanus TaxID=6706 RepID=A0A8J5JXK1_HOMAM|nr:hypothetical protein Hamer_G004482 [Homarus americanus]